MAYEYTSSNGTTYYLHTQKDAVLRGGVKRTIYYFANHQTTARVSRVTCLRATM